jgi:hypothetical protein
VSERRLVEFRDRLRDPLSFRLTYLEEDGSEQTREFVVPSRPARVWLGALLSDEPGDILLEVLAEEDADWLWGLVEDPDDELTEQTCRRIGLQLFARLTGRAWYASFRLLSAFVEDWHAFDGLASDRGLGDPMEWPVERLCNWIEFRLRSGCQSSMELHTLEAQLEAPPLSGEDGIDSLPEWSDEAIAADWVAAAGVDPARLT